MASHGTDYIALVDAVKAIIEGETDYVANLANVASIIYHELNASKQNSINWSGFYIVRPFNAVNAGRTKHHGNGGDAAKQQLVLGPFQGKVACIRIGFGRGVCGTVALNKTTLIVPNVHQFSGHIACDSASQSEIVVPILNELNELLGVLDIDSSVVESFGEADRQGLEKITQLLAKGSIWPNQF